MEGVSLLIGHGWDTNFVLFECPIDTFKDLVLLAQKQKLLLQQTLGITILSAIGSLFTKEAGTKLQEVLQEGLDGIDGKLKGDVESTEEEEDHEEFTMGTRQVVPRSRVKRKPSKSKVERMAAALHVNFAKLTGARIPSLDQVIARAQKEQVKGLEILRAEENEK